MFATWLERSLDAALLNEQFSSLLRRHWAINPQSNKMFRAESYVQLGKWEYLYDVKPTVRDSLSAQKTRESPLHWVVCEMSFRRQYIIRTQTGNMP